MAETTKSVLKVIATTSSKVRDLVIKDGQLVFIHDIGRIALDFKGKRTFYNQVTELESDAERQLMSSPLSGYYFVISTGCLWRYADGWTQITGNPKEVICIDVELPELGQAKENVLYVNKANQEIAVFDGTSNKYVIVSDYTKEATDEDIEDLFK